MSYEIERIAKRKGLKNNYCRYSVVAIGFDKRGVLVGTASNKPRMRNRGWHAEELLIRRYGKVLSEIKIYRTNKRGDFLVIHPCKNCKSMADKLGISIS